MIRRERGGQEVRREDNKEGMGGGKEESRPKMPISEAAPGNNNSN